MMSPFPIDPGWYEQYWLTERPARRHRLSQVVQRVVLALTEPLLAPQARADARVSACLTSVLVTLPPI